MRLSNLITELNGALLLPSLPLALDVDIIERNGVLKIEKEQRRVLRRMDEDENEAVAAITRRQEKRINRRQQVSIEDRLSVTWATE